jgi:hypothetical protein
LSIQVRITLKVAPHRNERLAGGDWMAENLIFRFTRPVTLLMQKAGRYRLVQLPQGSIIKAEDPSPDANGMIQGTYNGTAIMLFSIDLEERAELVLARTVGRAENPLRQRTA